MIEVCAISELPVDQCSHCRLADPHEREPDSRPFVARFDGECAGCGFDVRAGETVQFAAGGRLYHADHRRCADGT